ncbi:hypothetical protein TWF730_002470 [Orbilia blumenaviensis]|uniref:Uncharacterized protein n=1 Tax=Orbilia blumenaviensis TaxID=1796055 RepID=A0AAV9UA92_9PEZI
MIQPPKTPSTPLDRKFVRRTSVLSCTIATTYRRNSSGPQPLSPAQTPEAEETTVSSMIDSSFWSINDNTTFLADNTTYLQQNSGTKTNPPVSINTVLPVTPDFRQEVDKELEDPFTPFYPLPSSVTIRKRRRSGNSTTSSITSTHSINNNINNNSGGSAGSIRSISPPENARRSLSIHRELFPSITSSAEQMPNHPVYNFEGYKPRSFKSLCEQDIRHEEQFITSHGNIKSEGEDTREDKNDKKEDEGEDIPMDVDCPSPTNPFFTYRPSLSTENKENIDPKSPKALLMASSQHSSSVFTTPPNPGSGGHMNYTAPVSQKAIAARKKMQGVKENARRLSGGLINSSPFVTTSYGSGWNTPDSRKRSTDFKPFKDLNTLPETTTGSISSGSNHGGNYTYSSQFSTPTVQPKKKQFSTYSAFPEQPEGLVSKLGLLDGKKNATFDTSPTNQNYQFQASPAPVTPAPQKILHRSAKSNPEFTDVNYSGPPPAQPSLRNAKKLEELKNRFPRNMYESGSRKRKDLLKIARGELSLDEVCAGGGLKDKNEWSDGEVEEFGIDKEKAYGNDRMVDISWGF